MKESSLRKSIAAQAIATALLLLTLAGCAHRPAGEFTFVQMCDPQLGFGGHDADVARFRQAIGQINQLKPAFVVICGDLVNHPSEEAFVEFNALKAALTVPCYCAPGNHDVDNVPTKRSLAEYRKWIGKDYFSFKHKGYEFVVVNSQLWKAPVAGETEKQAAWLKVALESAAKQHRPVFIVDHHPLFVKKPDEDDTYYNVPNGKRQELMELFCRRGVVAVLSGHTHTTNIKEYQGIEMVASQTTSKNFDKQPFGFRLWHIGPQPPYPNEFVPLH